MLIESLIATGKFRVGGGTAHPSLTKKLFKLSATLQDSHKTMAVHVAAQPTINRLLGTDSELLRKFQNLPLTLSAFEQFFSPLGFELEQLSTPGVITIRSRENFRPASDLEKLRHSPSCELAEEIIKTDAARQSLVWQIMSYDLNNPDPTWSAVLEGFRFFFKLIDWTKKKDSATNQAIIFANRVIKIMTKVFEAEHSLPLELCADLTNAYLTLANNLLNRQNQPAAALAVLDQLVNGFTTYGLPIAFMELFHTLNIQQFRWERDLAYWQKIEAEGVLQGDQENNIGLYLARFFQIHARFFLSMAVLPTPDEARQLLLDHQQLLEESKQAFSNELINEGFLAPLLAWVHLRAGDLEQAVKFIQQAIETKQQAPFCYYGILACLFNQSGHSDEAIDLARSVLNGGFSKKLLTRHQAITTELQNLIPQEPQSPLPAERPTTAKPPEHKAKIELMLDDLVLRENWQHYRTVFPNGREGAIFKALNRSIQDYIDLFKEIPFSDWERHFTTPTEVELDVRVKQALTVLGIVRLDLAWENGLKVLIHPQPGVFLTEQLFYGAIDNQYGLTLSSRRDLKLVRTLLQATILEGLGAKYFEDKNLDTVATALNATSELPPIVTQPLSQPIREIVPLMPQPLPAPPASPAAALPEVKVEVKQVKDAQERFCRIHQQLFTRFGRLVNEAGIDLLATNETAQQDIQNLIEIVAKHRDLEGSEFSFPLEPSRFDPLAAIIKKVQISGPVRAREKLLSFGLSEQIINSWGFDLNEPSTLLSLVGFDFEYNKQPRRFFGIITRNGNFFIPGVAKGGELSTALQRTALECLSRIACSILEQVIVFSPAAKPAPRTPQSNPAASKSEQAQRFRSLPAIVILNESPTADNLTRALASIHRQLQTIELTQQGFASQVLYTNEDRIFTPHFDPAERQRLLSRLPLDQLFIRRTAKDNTGGSFGYSYRLQLGNKITPNGQPELLPFCPDDRKLTIARQMPVKVDLDPYLYFYAIYRFTGTAGDQYLVHPYLPPIAIEDTFPPVPNLTPKYRLQQAGPFTLKVYPEVDNSYVDHFLSLPEIQAAIDGWQTAFIPPDLFYAKNKARIAYLLTLEFLERYFLIMPTYRAYNQGQFVPCSEVKISEGL